MSVSASISWTIHKKNDALTQPEIIKLLLKSGWSINDHDEMSYLPLHDNEMYNWQREPINEDKLFKILTEKAKLKEPLGVCITWKDTNIGGSLLILSDTELSLGININRKTIALCNDTVITDVNWYLSKINPILSYGNGIIITSTNFNEM